MIDIPLQAITPPPRVMARLLKECGGNEGLVSFHLARGDKYCFQCRRWKPMATAWARDKRRGDGVGIYCKECVNSYARTRYTGITMQVDSGVAFVPPELFPPTQPGQSIGCLRCRHADSAASTNFQDATPVTWVKIFCHRQEKTVPICWSNCPLADPRPSQPRDLARYWKKHGPLGDKVAHATPLAVEFLRHCWAHWKAADLERVTGWTMFKLAQIVRYHKVGGVAVGNTRLHWMEPTKGRVVFTREQSDWVMSEYHSPRWPAPYVYCMKPAKKAAITRARKRIIEHVATLGPRWEWTQIQRHIQKRQKLNYGRARRRGVRPVNQFCSAPE